MSIVSVLSDSACKWSQVKLEALVVGDSLSDSRRRNPGTPRRKLLGYLGECSSCEQEGGCYRTKVPELQMHNAVLFCRAEYGNGQ